MLSNPIGFRSQTLLINNAAFGAHEEQLSVTLTKQDLVDSIHRQLGGSRKESSELIESTLEIIKSKLAADEDVLISRFGKFHLLEKGARPARNPKTGQEVMIGKKRVVAFKCSPVLRDKLNGRE